MILPCILVMRQQHILSFLCFSCRPTSYIASIKVSVFFCMVSMLFLSRFTSSAYTSRWYFPFNFSPTRFSWTVLMAYSKAKMKNNGDKASPCFLG
jgi:hypothetical protein